MSKLPKDFQLYTEEGWLNIEGIAKIPFLWLIVIVGARQVGKSYGIARHLMTSKDCRGLYLRRTTDELDLISGDPDLDPFMTLKEENITAGIVKLKKSIYHYGLCEMDDDGYLHMTEEKGLGLSLATIAKLRGFNGSGFTDVFFDEFIPETSVIKRKNEGDSLVQAYITINGNRELKGKPPLRLWMAANALDISSPHLAAWDLTDKIRELGQSGQEYALIENGVLVVVPKSTKIIEQRKSTAIMEYLAKTGASKELYDVSINNTFAYDSLDLVRKKPISGYRPFAKFGDMYVWYNADTYYVCSVIHNKREVFGDNADERLRAAKYLNRMRVAYAKGLVTFESATLLLKFRDYFGIRI